MFGFQEFEQLFIVKSRLSKTNLLDAPNLGIDRILVDAGGVWVRLDVCKLLNSIFIFACSIHGDLNSLNARIVVSTGSRLHRSFLMPLAVEAPVVIQPIKTRTSHFMRASFRIEGVGMTLLKAALRPTK
jgi:hypothetical protein